MYYQPPENLKLKFPCIVYDLNRIQNQFADNIKYVRSLGFRVTYITRNPDDEAIVKINDLPFCSFDRTFVSDNLHHYEYTIYFKGGNTNAQA